MEHFAYYTLRVHASRHPAHAPGEPPGPVGAELSGVVERLDTGEKHGFANGLELLRLVGGWTSGPNMQPGAERGNDGGGASDAPPPSRRWS